MLTRPVRWRCTGDDCVFGTPVALDDATDALAVELRAIAGTSDAPEECPACGAALDEERRTSCSSA